MYAGPEIKKWSALAFALLLLTGGALKAAIADESKQLVIVGIEGKLEFSRAGSQSWDPSYTNQHLLPGDRLRTGQHSRATFQFGGTMGNLDQNSSLLVPDPAEKPVIPLLEGIFYFFHRDKPDQYRLRTPMASAVVRGTEFVIKIEPGGATTITLLEGAADIQTTNETISLSGKEQLVLAPGAKPVRTPVLDAMNVIQWRLYYPAVLDLEELPLNDSEREALRKSISSYQDGDLLRALEDYPENRQPYSVAERVYQAGLMLAVGRVDEAQSILPQTGDLNRPAEALRELIAAVQFREFHRTQPAKLASEWLAESYYLQSRASIDPEALDKALAAAGQAVAASTNFGFAWARLAELEFSFGKTGPALDALERALKLTPRNAQAMALQGFLFSAQNRITRALQSFEQAIALDNGLANGWLGRGLCRIKKGDAAGGYLDLLTAAALEPQRSLLRSYLGKAYADAGDDAHATHELKLALELDPKDPTGWLYSALHKQQQNRINEAITDLETSQELNDSRSLFRSRFLLDEDRAVRSANLASIYRDAGMTDVSVREAAKAVTYDYANDSAHLFLADSYNELRDPTRFNLRYETVWFNEMLLANLLAPVGGGRLSQHVSQQEYSRLFEANGFGLANSTLYRSDGRLEELASQYGTFDRTSYSFDLDYQHNDGVRPNNSLNSIEWYTTFKQQLTPADTALVLIKYENYHSVDNFQYYDPTNARPHFKFDEYQEPIIFGAWHHEWSPNIHTLLLGGRISQEQNFSDKKASQLLLVEDSAGATYASDFEPFDVTYRNQLELYSVELCQIFQWDRVNLTFGARYQAGEIRTESSFTNPPSGLAVLFSNPVAYGNFSEDVERITGYGYLTLEPINHVRIIGGLAYDDISYPSNFRNPPISGGQDSKSQLGPKAGLVWDPIPQATLRGVATRSLGGVSDDESFRLEPAQLAGFPQAFRTLISESTVGSVSAPEYKTYGVALDLKFPTRTYAGLQFEWLESDVARTVGALSLKNGLSPFVTDTTRETLAFRQESATASINQLAGDYLTFGASYKFSHIKLDDAYPDIPVSALASANSSVFAELHEVGGYILFNHPCGLFAKFESHWYHQNNFGYSTYLQGDDFVQHNFYVGYRFLHRRVEVTFGILNLTDQDYHLNSLTTYSELPRERTFAGRLSFIF